MSAPAGGEAGADEPLRTLEFVAPVPGLEGHRTFALVALDDAGRLYSLRSASDPAVRLLVVSPASFFPDYSPEVDDDTCAALELTDAADASVLCVVNPGDSAAGATVNLLAPVVVNVRSRRAMQVVLAGSDLPLRRPLLAA
jgi:flagellar assembly factor FliW